MLELSASYLHSEFIIDRTGHGFGAKGDGIMNISTFDAIQEIKETGVEYRKILNPV